MIRTTTKTTLKLLVLCSAILIGMTLIAEAAQAQARTPVAEGTGDYSLSYPQGKYVLGADPTEIAGTSFCTTRSSIKFEETQDQKQVATLQNYTEGICTTTANPETKWVELQFEGDDCGSKIFVGTGHDDQNCKIDVRVVDHTRRECKDRVLSKLEVTVTVADSAEPTLFALRRNVGGFRIQPVFSNF